MGSQFREGELWVRYREMKSIVQGVGGVKSRAQMTDATLGSGFRYGFENCTLPPREERRIDGFQARLLRNMWRILPKWANERHRLRMLKAGWKEGSLTEWRNSHRTIPWSLRLRKARVDLRNDLMRGDKVHPAGRAIVNAEGRVFTALPNRRHLQGAIGGTPG